MILDFVNPDGMTTSQASAKAPFPTKSNTPYVSPDGRLITVTSSMGVLFSDDFGGSALDTAGRWDVYDGGLGAVQQSTGPQAAIGTTITGITDAVSASALAVTMGQTTNAERWYLSKQIFAGAEDLTVVLKRNVANGLVENSVWIGLVEVDITTGFPILNPNLANDFTNRTGVDYAKSVSNSQVFLEAVADSSPSVASLASNGFAPSAMTTAFETLIEYHAEDMIASSSVVDVLNNRSAQARLSSQVANDTKAYKLLMRFRNIGTPAASHVYTISRILLVDSQEQRVEVTSGRGDISGGKAIAATTIAGSQMALGTATGSVAAGALSYHKLISAATTNATVVKAGNGRIYGGMLSNMTAVVKFVKFYNKATAPTVGTDTPVLTIPLQPNSGINLSAVMAEAIGASFSAGISYAITGLAADSDTTAVAAGDVITNVIYA